MFGVAAISEEVLEWSRADGLLVSTIRRMVHAIHALGYGAMWGRHTSEFDVGSQQQGPSGRRQCVPIENFRVVSRVEDILDIELQCDVRLELPLRHRVEAGIAIDVFVRRSPVVPE
jgi:hypothetical protein